MVAHMVADMVANMVADMVADMEVDMVVDMIADMVANMVADNYKKKLADMELNFDNHRPSFNFFQLSNTSDSDFTNQSSSSIAKTCIIW